MPPGLVTVRSEIASSRFTSKVRNHCDTGSLQKSYSSTASVMATMAGLRSKLRTGLAVGGACMNPSAQ